MHLKFYSGSLPATSIPPVPIKNRLESMILIISSRDYFVVLKDTIMVELVINGSLKTLSYANYETCFTPLSLPESANG
jgi:hypothetical protein